MLGRHDEAAAAAATALEFYRAHGPRVRAAVAASLHGQLLTDPLARATAFDEAIAAGEPMVALDARVGRARALLELERAGDAVDDFVEAVALCTERDIEDGAAFLRDELARAYQAAGRSVEASEVAEEAVAALSRLGHHEAAANTQYFLAGVYRDLEDNAGALALYEGLVANLGDNLAGRGQIRESFGDLLYKLDRDAEAAERFGEAAGDLHTVGDLPGEVRLLRRRVMALHWADDTPAAEETVRVAEQRHAELDPADAAQPQLIWERAMLGFEAGRLLNARNRHAEAVPYLTESGERLRAIGAIGDAEQVEALLGAALRSSGQAVESEVVLRRLLDSMDPDAKSRRHAAYQLAETLDVLGRGKKAEALRRREGIVES
jgi:tetratricopeptide (TPR) repeat protein